MSIILDGTSGITSSGSITTQSSSGVIFSDSSNQGAAASPYVLKNRIINGDMRIDQRNAGASVTANGYTLDRWRLYNTQSSKLTIQQNAGSVTPPEGFTNYLGMTSSSAYTVTSTDVFQIYQWVEGYNMADFDWGKATAKTVTLSFRVRSSLTGTFGGALQNGAGNRSYPFSYTISSANTWETKTVTITGDTSGTWTTDNTAGVAIIFCYGAGSTNAGTAGAWTGSGLSSVTGATSVVGTNGATFYITGVQLEVGSTATPFERRMYGTELLLCQRYYQQLGSGVGTASSATAFTGAMQFLTQMRASPTLSVSAAMSITDTNSADYTQSSGAISIVNGNRINSLGANFNCINFTGLTANKLYISMPTAYSNGIILASAEL